MQWLYKYALHSTYMCYVGKEGTDYQHFHMTYLIRSSHQQIIITKKAK